MSLPYDEIESYLYRVFTGKHFVIINDIPLIFVYPSNEIKQRADFVYKESYTAAIADGMLSTEDLTKLVDRRQLISAEEIAKLTKLRSQLEAQEVILGKTTRVKANQDRVKNIVNRLKHEIRTIEFKKQSKMFLSAENKAEEEKAFYLCSMSVFKDNGDLFWKTYSIAKKEKRLELKDNILLAFLKFSSGLTNSIIRELARSNLWRIRYVNSMKTSDPLFGVPTSEYTTDQLNLAYWSNYYQNIYEMMPEDRPSDMVIEDDDALDAYMKTYYEERNREDAARRSKTKTSGKLQAFNAEEVIVTRSNELYQDIEYDKPREAQKIKDRIDLKKKAKHRR